MIPGDPVAETRARNRFIVLMAVRLTGLALILAGIAIHEGVFILPKYVAYIFAGFGMFDFFIAPMLISRSWQKQDR